MARAIVIAHRGACALLPEHTLAAYARAIADGADWIEPDLVCTRDGVLVARHENEIGATTDVANRPEFAARRATRSVDGRTVEGWFVEDFTFAELHTLRARERLPDLRSTAYDGEFAIPTFDDILELLATESATRGRDIGVIPEVKHPSHFRALGLPIEERLLAQLDAHAITRRVPVVIQSFETGNLRNLRAQLGARANVRLMQLLGAAHKAPADAEAGVTYATLATHEGLRDIATYAHVLGIPSRAIVPVAADGRMAAPTTLVADAHAAGLEAMAYTFRPENHFLPRALWHGEDPRAVNETGSIAEIRAVLAAGVDGLFADHPAIARAAVDGA